MAQSLAPDHGGSGGTAAGDRSGTLKSPQEQAAHYRDYAAQIRSLVKSERNASLRQKLAKIAREYEALAKEFTPKRG
jgi:hypothetical protein